MIPVTLVAATLVAGPVQDSTAVYEAAFLRAAPGRLLELIEGLRARMPVFDLAGRHRPVMLRHSQGDQWDVLLLTPVGSLAEHFGAATAERWHEAVVRSGFDQAGFDRLLDGGVSWREELYVRGPPVATLDSALAGQGYFHLEVFQALAGRRDSLLRQRRMENDFLLRIGRPANLVFTRIAGAAWDVFTLGLYRDLLHYAAPASVSPEAEDRAARAAGFESRGDIGTYLRRFLNGHHDTLGTIVR